MKKLFYVLVLFCSLLLISGCGDKINKDSPLYKAKENMVKKLDNYAMDANIALVNIEGAKVNLQCKEDRKNEITYCRTTAVGVGTEEYTDNKNKVSYSKVYDDYGVTTENEWVKTKLPSSEADDQWLGLNDYIFELEEEKMESGTKYSGIINLKKIFGLLEKFDLPIDFAGFMDKDVDITVIVNNDNYIEKMNMSFEVLGVKMVVDLNYYDYNKIGDVVIPDEVLKAKEN